MPKNVIPNKQLRTSRNADFSEVILLDGEDPAAYRRLLTEVTRAVSPKDVIEEFWVRDVVDLVWETMRLRRLKTSLLNASAANGLKLILKPVVGYVEAGRLADQWFAHDPEARQHVDALLAQLELTLDAVMAQTLAVKLDDVERIDRMIASAEARRHLVLREVDRHRAAVAARLREASETVVDAQFSEVLIEHGRDSKIA